MSCAIYVLSMRVCCMVIDAGERMMCAAWFDDIGACGPRLCEANGAPRLYVPRAATWWRGAGEVGRGVRALPRVPARGAGPDHRTSAREMRVARRDATL